MKTEKENQHDFIQMEAGGTGFERSWSHQKCKKCGQTFTHYYNVESYEEAKKKAGISNLCQTK